MHSTGGPHPPPCSGPDAGLPVMKNPHEEVTQKGTLSNRG